MRASQVVLYHMCEVYSEIGFDRISVTHMASGATNFLVVALGGTIIGKWARRDFYFVSTNEII